jgi:hypothetical protein
MTRANLSGSQDLLESLTNSQLSKITLDPTGEYLQLEFVSTSDGKDIIVAFYNVIQYTFSRVLDEGQGPFFIGHVTRSLIVDGGEQILSSLHYPFFRSNGSILSYPSRNLWYFQLEGGICLDIVCSAYKILKEIT